MAELKHILAATDLSGPARHAVERAALVAAGSDAALAMIHIANLAPLDQVRQLLSSEPERLEQDLVDQLRDALRTLAATIHERFGVTPALRVATGDLLPELLNHAATLPADLLVLGARGSSFLRHILLGTTAERLLSSSRVPMLIVKQPPHEPYRQLLVPVDFSASSLRALRLARTIAPRADISVLHVFEVPFEGQLRYARPMKLRSSTTAPSPTTRPGKSRASCAASPNWMMPGWNCWCARATCRNAFSNRNRKLMRPDRHWQARQGCHRGIAARAGDPACADRSAGRYPGEPVEHAISSHAVRKWRYPAAPCGGNDENSDHRGFTRRGGRHGGTPEQPGP